MLEIVKQKHYLSCDTTTPCSRRVSRLWIWHVTHLFVSTLRFPHRLTAQFANVPRGVEKFSHGGLSYGPPAKSQSFGELAAQSQLDASTLTRYLY